jgi:hypothetical protein
VLGHLDGLGASEISLDDVQGEVDSSSEAAAGRNL